MIKVIKKNNVIEISDFAFEGCTGLNSLTVGKNNQYYCGENNCILTKEKTSLIVGCKNSIIPDGITKIGKDCTMSLYQLTKN